MKLPSLPGPLRRFEPRRRLAQAEHLDWSAHAAIIIALAVDLWVGGDFIEAHLGFVARSVFEITMIGAWLVLVLGMRWWGDRDRRPPSDRR